MGIRVHGIIIITFVTSTFQCDDYMKLSQISKDTEEILYSINAPTLTSCHMQCSRERECGTIGFTKDTDKGSFYNCHLLKKKKMEDTTAAHSKPSNEDSIIKLENTAAPAIKWREFLFVGSKERQVDDTLLTTIEKIPKQYKLHVEIKRTNYSNTWEHIVYFTSGAKYGVYGERTPVIVFDRVTKNGLVVGTALDGKPVSYFVSGIVHPLNKWIKIEISQEKQGKDFIYSIFIDGKKAFSHINTKPDIFYNVKVYLGFKGKLVGEIIKQPGFVRNFWMKVKN